MSLFDAPKGSTIVHACNAQGVWGSGIAAIFKQLYPDAFAKYRNVCLQYLDKRITVGRGFIFHGHKEPHNVGCLITSENYGAAKDPAELIKIQTTLAVLDIIDRACSLSIDPDVQLTLYSNKFNSGLFNVPWEATELILTTLLKRHDYIDWIVCDPNLKT